MTSGHNKTDPKTLQAIIVGSGFSGLCMAIQLKQAGINEFLILEKASGLGGTWRENIYPGAECDIPSALYSFSFEPNPNWHQKWSGQPQILAYQHWIAKKYGLNEHFRFRQTVESAIYDEDMRSWHVVCDNGDAYQAQHFISAVGQLHEVAKPDFNDLDKYQGACFHAAQWDSNVHLTGKKVAVIGNAASAVQLIPEIAQDVESLTVFQRSANWMLAKPNRAISRLEKWLYKRLPFTQKLARLSIWLKAEYLLFPAIKGNFIARWAVTQMALLNVRKHIKDPALREKLKPDYPLGAKRTLFSHHYYQTLALEHVDLETKKIHHFTENGLCTQDGQTQNFDVIIFATGFQTNPFLKSMQIQGLHGKTLNEHWRDGAFAYLGLHTHHFPNLHILYGPNTNLGHNSIIAMIEAQCNYLTQIIITLAQKKLDTIQIKQQSELDFNLALQARLNGMSFNKVKHSWYLDNGKITNNWSDSVSSYHKQLKKVDWSAYQLS